MSVRNSVRKWSGGLTAAGFVFAGWVGGPASWAAAPEAAKPPAAPADKPVDDAALREEIGRLVRDLGDDSFEKREAAQKRLVEIGKPALPALREAAKDKDVEVRNRAVAAVESIEPAAKPPAVGRPDRPGGALILPPGNPGGMRQMRIQIHGGNGEKQVAVEEDGRKIEIRENADGIIVRKTETGAGGKSETTEWKGKTVEDLKKASPEAAELYDKYAGGAGQIQIFGGGAGPNGGGFRIMPRPILPRRNDQRAEEHRKRMEEALRQLGPQGEDLLKQLREMEEMQNRILRGDGGIEKMLREMEELQRRMLQREFGQPGQPGVPVLPGNPGGVVPPAPRIPGAEDDEPKLGVEAEDVDATLRNQLRVAGGVVVKSVLPGSRAEKMGLREHDVLLKLNGRDIGNLRELKRAVSDGRRVVLEGLREGKAFKAEEAAEK